MRHEARFSIAGLLRPRPLLAGIGVAALWVATLLWAPAAYGSHRLGSVISPVPQEIGPDSGAAATGPNTWEVTIDDADPVTTGAGVTSAAESGWPLPFLGSKKAAQLVPGAQRLPARRPP